MNTSTDRDAIRKIYPTLAERRDYTIAQDGTLSSWLIRDARFPQPTAEQIANAKATLAATAATIQAISAALSTQLAALPAGERAFYAPVASAVALKLAARDVAAARDIIATAPAVTNALQAIQTAMLALFPQ